MNAKQELLDKIESYPVQVWFTKPYTIKCCEIRMEYWELSGTSNEILLREGYTQEEYQEFLEKLDFEYDSGYGIQHMYGTVWFTEPGVWMERRDYDGSEWWEIYRCPEIPEVLKA